MMSAHEARPDPDVEAREWLIQLTSDDVTQEDFIAWSDWMEASAANKLAYDAAASAWELAGAAKVRRPARTELKSDAYRGQVAVAEWRRSSAKRRVWWSASAAAACAAVVAGLALTLSMSNEPAQTLETMRAQHLQTNLSDGSTIRLGAMTVAKVAFTAKERGVALERGEVLVKVAHDARRPFVVQTPLAAVTAVGTAFDVDVGGEGLELYVTEGVVSVDVGPVNARAGSGAAVRVAAGERLKVSRGANGRFQLIQELGTLAPAWTEGWLQYRDEPLAAVLADVNRYHDRQIVLADPSIGSLRYSGSVGLAQIGDWLAGLERAFPLAVVDRQGDLLLVRKSARPRASGRT